VKFQDAVKKSMEQYKVYRLGITLNGKYKGKEYSHILPKELAKLNIFEYYRHEFFNYMKKDFKPHIYFHHLNSSQAACFNFFFPFVHEDRLDIIAKILNIGEELIIEYAFEKVLDNDENTNFDFYLETNKGRRVYFEIKYSEYGFGKAKNDERHQQKCITIYQSRLRGKIKDEYNNMDDCLKNYQIFRNISYLDKSKKDLLIFIFPEGHTKLKAELDKVINNYLVDDYKENVKFYYWERLLNNNKFINENPSARLVTTMELFKEKYLGYQKYINT
jgi:hypothetical protein